jgi:hypothetical protein
MGQIRNLHEVALIPLEGLTESYEVDWFGSCCFHPAPRFENAFPTVRSTSCWRTLKPSIRWIMIYRCRLHG